MTEYNGWTNYETWLTNLHFDCSFDFTDQVEDGVFDDMDERDVLDYVSEYIEQTVNEYLSNVVDGNNLFVQDIITNSFLREVDWSDIGSHYVDDIMTEVQKRNEDSDQSSD